MYQQIRETVATTLAATNVLRVYQQIKEQVILAQKMDTVIMKTKTMTTTTTTTKTDGVRRRLPPRKEHIEEIVVKILGATFTTKQHEQLQMWRRWASLTDGDVESKQDLAQLFILCGPKALEAVSAIAAERRWMGNTIETQLAGLSPVVRIARQSGLAGVGLVAEWYETALKTASAMATAMGPRWNTDTGIFTLEEMATWKAAAATNKMALAAWLSSGKGHRIGDVLKLEVQGLSGGGPQDLGPSLTFVHHKTANAIGPFASHLPKDHPIVSLFQQLASKRKALREHFFFLDYPPPTQSPANFKAWRKGLEAQTVAAEAVLKRELHITKDLRCLRRTGLTMAATRANSDEEILQVSFHKDVTGLRAYLGSGKLSPTMRETQLRLSSL